MLVYAHASPVAVTPPVDPLAILARAANRAESQATRELLLRLSPHVLGVLGTLLGRGDPDIDDIAQESMVAIVRALGTFRFESSVVHFARCVTIRQAHIALRHRRAQRRSSAATTLRDDLDETVEREGPSPLGAMMAAERMQALRDMVAELPEEQAETLTLRVLLGCSIEEIADLTSTPVNTVRSRLLAAKSALRDRIAQDDRLTDREGDS